MKPHLSIIASVALCGCNHSNTGPPFHPNSAAQPTPNVAAEPPLMTVGQLKQDMLAYNLKPVRVTALVVDFGDGSVLQSCGQAAMFGTKAVDANITSRMWSKAQNTSSGWVVADDLGSYFTSSSFTNTNSGHILVQPPVPAVHYLDYVEVVGVYDANANTIESTSIKTIKHYSQSQ